MCGIAGIYNLDGSAIEINNLKRFTDSMLHRGPDASGYELFQDNSLGLGQRRLSILDLSDSGKQPMSYANGRYWITYNGEVFNFEQIWPHRGHEYSCRQNSVEHKTQPNHLQHGQSLNQPFGAGVEHRKQEGGRCNQRNANLAIASGIAS